MAGLIAGTFGPPAALPAQKDFFSRHVWTWIPALFRDLVAHPDAAFYRAVGAAGGRFLETEHAGVRAGRRRRLTSRAPAGREGLRRPRQGR